MNTNIAFDWTYSFPDLNNKFQLNLQWCDKCLNTTNADGSEINLKNSYNPLNPGDRRYNVLSSRIFNTTSNIAFSVKTNFVPQNWVCQGIILDRAYSQTLLDNPISNFGKDNSMCIYNVAWTPIFTASYGVRETSALYTFANGDIY